MNSMTNDIRGYFRGSGMKGTHPVARGSSAWLERGYRTLGQSSSRIVVEGVLKCRSSAQESQMT